MTKLSKVSTFLMRHFASHDRKECPNYSSFMGIFDVEVRTKDRIFRSIYSTVRSYFVLWTGSYSTYYGLQKYAMQCTVDVDWYRTNDEARERTFYTNLDVVKNRTRYAHSFRFLDYC